MRRVVAALTGHEFWRSPRFYIGSLIATALAASAVSWAMLSDMRQRMQEEQFAQAANIVSLVATDLSRVFREIDESLKPVVALVESEAFQAASPAERHQLISRTQANARVLSLRIIDQHGGVDFANHGDIFTTIGDIVAHTQQMRSERPATLMTPPIKDATGNASVIVSRPYLMNGRTNGVVAAHYDIGRIARRIAAIRLNEGDTISLTFDDRQIVYRSSDGLAKTGTDVSTTEVMTAAAKDTTGRFKALSSIDRVTKTYLHQPIEGTPLRVLYGLSDQQDIRQFWARGGVIIAAIAFLVVVLLGLACALAREFTRRAAVEQQLLTLTRRDGLTRLANRRFFDERLQAEWNRALRQRRPVALVLMDADYFKRFNDRNGHPEGDKLLQLIAGEVAKLARRPGDLAARYGGEEFALLLPGLDCHLASVIADRLRTAIFGLNVPHEAHPLGRVTVSLGVASLIPDASVAPADLLECADHALYRAKAGGRNCSRSADDFLQLAAA